MLGVLAQDATTTTTSAAGTAAGIGFVFVVVVILIAYVVIVYASLWKLFTKAGQKGWTALIPILNLIVMLKVVHKDLLVWLIWLIIPCTAPFAALIIYWDLVKAYGKGVGFYLGVLILPFIFFPVLGFGSAQYVLQPDPMF